MAIHTHADVVGVGANSVDHVAVVPGFPLAPGPVSKLPIVRYAMMCGGQMATALAACARLGLRTRYVGTTGSDANGRLVREALGRLDIDVSNLKMHDATNQFAFVLVDDRTGERIIFWDRDERLNFGAGELPEGAFDSCRLVHVDDTDEAAAIEAARLARARGVPVTSDIDRVTGRTLQIIDAVDVALFAENVPLQLVDGGNAGHGDQGGGIEAVTRALERLPRRPNQLFCATLGRRGVVAADDEGTHYQPAFDVPVKDTTGAGDVFRGGFIYARLAGWPLDEQLRFASAAAALSCARLGALASVPALEEVEELLRRK